LSVLSQAYIAIKIITTAGSVPHPTTEPLKPVERTLPTLYPHRP
jgi:hypothetical protein